LAIRYSNLSLPTPTFIGAAVGQDSLFGSGSGVRCVSVCVRESALEYRYRWRSHIFLFGIHFFVAIFANFCGTRVSLFFFLFLFLKYSLTFLSLKAFC